jgi:serine O-acetyltransferase
MENKTDQYSIVYLLRADLLRYYSILHKKDYISLRGTSFLLGIVSPRFIPVILCRLAYFLYMKKLPPIAKLVSFANFFIFGIEISVRCRIGPGLLLPHTQGTVIGAWSIGSNAIIFQGVTLGARDVDFQYSKISRPVIGNNVIIGSGAKVLGGLIVGDGARIGANSVVLKSVPSMTLAVGAPARIVDTFNS